MNKFFVIRSSSNKEPVKYWACLDDVLKMLEDPTTIEVIRASTDQIASLLYADPVNEVMWIDIKEEKYEARIEQS